VIEVTWPLMEAVIESAALTDSGTEMTKRKMNMETTENLFTMDDS
jgi:hypothetical protein